MKQSTWSLSVVLASFLAPSTFTDRIDPDGVKATMENGILSIWAPKAKKPKSRKVQISS
jgi:HSP20 family molecular chaperone IbpA